MEQSTIDVLDRETKQSFNEKVFGGAALRFLYENPIGAPFRELISRSGLFSCFYGWWQKQPWTRGKIKKFIDDYQIDASEFLDQVESFQSFNDFFTRRLKPSSRPIASSDAIIPADGRYHFFQDISKVDGYVVKRQKFDLPALLGSSQLAQRYADGAMVMARLSPVDYHRFHFPIDCIPEEAKCINGYLYSVNPIAVKKNIQIFSENKRVLTILESSLFGQVLFIEVGATNVGTITQTHIPFQSTKKGVEKGYFSFGGSSLILLFEKNRIFFDADLRETTEIYCKMGQSMGASQR